MKKTFAFFFAMGLLTWLSSTPVFAGLAVEPGIIEILAARRDEASGPIKVRNTGKEKTHVSVEPEDWKKGASGRRGGPVSEWLSVEPKEMDLDPGQTGAFTYRARVAPDAAGENTAQIFFSEMVGRGGTEIRTRVGVILYLAVRESVRLTAEISKVSVNAVRDGKEGIVTAQVGVINQGNVHIRPTGDVKVYDSTGKFHMAVVLATGWGMLPGEPYTYQGSGRGPLLKPGKYKAVASMQYGKLYKQDKTDSKEFYFEVGPGGVVADPKGK